MGKLIDLTGMRFRHLLVLRRSDRGSKRRMHWWCLCDCGMEKEIQGSHLRSGATISCGCRQHGNTVTHGAAKAGKKEKLYLIWSDMRDRCRRKSSTSYHNYGGRGIRVCEIWDSSYPAFREWAQTSGFKEGLRIDRMDNDGPYTPENCRWVTNEENCQNTRRTKLDPVKVKAARVAFQAGIMTQKEIAKFFGVGTTALCSAINGKSWKNINL